MVIENVPWEKKEVVLWTNFHVTPKTSLPPITRIAFHTPPTSLDFLLSAVLVLIIWMEIFQLKEVFVHSKEFVIVGSSHFSTDIGITFPPPNTCTVCCTYSRPQIISCDWPEVITLHHFYELWIYRANLAFFLFKTVASEWRCIPY